MQSSIFKSSFYKFNPVVDENKFSELINKYMQEHNQSGMKLTNDELSQLSWHMGNAQVTPEARGEDAVAILHFEIKRSLSRRYSFELLLQGKKEAYLAFIADQKDNQLSFDDFEKISKEAQSLDVDTQIAVKASCFLAMSDYAKSVLAKANYTLSKDSEEFLTELSEILRKNSALFPLTRSLTENQLTILQKIYWPNMHFRHMLYTEGGDNMTKTFAQGLAQEQFNEKDFLAWKWRWLTNIFGFQGGIAAKYYHAETHQLVTLVVNELQKLLKDPTHNYLDSYLKQRAEIAGLNSESISKNEQQFLGHLAAFYHQINILNAQLGDMIYQGYLAFKAQHAEGAKIADLYVSKNKNINALTATYVPAVINQAYLLLKNKFKLEDKENLKKSSQFMCQFLNKFLTIDNNERISCMNLAKEASMEEILNKWLDNDLAIDFSLNDNNEMVAVEVPQLKKVLGM